MSNLKISPDLALPIDVASQAVAVLGIRGAGKTNTATVFAEELLAQGQPMVYIDPTDGAWGLRSGFPVFIFGGTHGASVPRSWQRRNITKSLNKVLEGK